MSSTKPTKLTVDALTGHTAESELTADEISEIEIAKQESEALKNFALAKSVARESALAKLAALGLTEEEIGAL